MLVMVTLFFSTSIYCLSVNHESHELRWKKQGVVTYSTDQEKEVSKMLITSLGNWIEQGSTPWAQAVRTLEYGLLSQLIIAHLVPER